MIPRVLIIAGSDSGGGAGIQADIKTVTMLGGHAMTAITAVTAQNTLGVQAVHSVPTDIVIAQIESCLSDIGADAVKIGMIGSAETANAVADYLDRLSLPIVFDPVMVATSGADLADAATVATFGRFMEIASIVTPNLPEYRVLVDHGLTEHCSPILVKGGHGAGDRIEDILLEHAGETTWEHERIHTTSTHGTGCSLASAIATGLGAGMKLGDAVDRAIRYVGLALRAAPHFGHGSGPIGHALGQTPFYHLLAANDVQGFDVAAFAARWG